MFVDIPEASPEEAPVAIAQNLGTHITNYRLWNGHLWVEQYRPTPLRQLLWAVPAGVPIGQSLRLNNNGYLFRYQHPLFPHDVASRRNFDVGHRVEDDANEAQEALESEMACAVLETASEHLIVGNALYSKSSGPVLVLEDQCLRLTVADLRFIERASRLFSWTEAAEAADVCTRATGKPVAVQNMDALTFLKDVPPPEPDTNTMVERVAWYCLWDSKTVRMEAGGRQLAAAVVGLREAMAARWPTIDINYRGALGDMYPHRRGRMDFPSVTPLLPALQRYLHASPSTSTLAVARHRIDDLCKAALDDDFTALDCATP